MGLSNKLSCETGSFSYCHKPHRFLQPEVFEAFFSHAGTLGCTVHLASQLFLPIYLHTNMGPSCLPSDALPGVLSTQLPVSTLPSCLDECFFSNSLVVGLPYSLIFWQFGYFLFSNLLLSFFCLCKEAKFM